MSSKEAKDEPVILACYMLLLLVGITKNSTSVFIQRDVDQVFLCALLVAGNV